ncbi:MAG TPA: transporter [Jatrophihabitans sp.]|nr:transporter [Jatrophihabitans sp.]
MTRLALVLGCIVLFALLLLAMRWGWRNRASRQAALPELPTPPGELGTDLVAPLTGLYVGTTVATRWQDRIVVHGLGVRADASARLARQGVLIERQGAPDIFLPIGQLSDARLEPALAGKVVGRGGLLVLRWQHGGQLLDTGIRGDDRSQYPAWIKAISQSKQETEAK